MKPGRPTLRQRPVRCIAAEAHRHFVAALRAAAAPGLSFDCPQPYLAAPALSPEGSDELVSRLLTVAPSEPPRILASRVV